MYGHMQIKDTARVKLITDGRTLRDGKVQVSYLANVVNFFLCGMRVCMPSTALLAYESSKIP